MGLVHWPVVDRLNKQVATNITNLDIHDIARAGRVFGVERYYLIHPMREQQMFVHRVLDHWRTGRGAQFNPMRKTALTDVYTADTLSVALKEWNELCGAEALCIATSARDEMENPILSFKTLRARLQEQPGQPLFLIFGTGFGLHKDVYKAVHGVLEPIRGASSEDYRHLSVRSAVSICLDRLLGTW
jgi:hypothetical protein